MEVTREQREHLRAEWLKALRSGEFGQCRNHLHVSGGGYCCLGVACEVFNRLHPGEIHIDKSEPGFRVRYDGSPSVLPQTVQKAFGLRSSSGSIVPHPAPVPINNAFPCSLAAANDLAQATFAQIADFIEQNPEKVFVD